MRSKRWNKKSLEALAFALTLASGAARAILPPPANLHVANTAPVPAQHTMDRAAVAAMWRQYVPTSEGVPANWTGNVVTCDAGDINPGYRSAELQRLNWFRSLAGTPGDAVFLAEMNAENQRGALVEAANQVATHTLTPEMKCYTADAADSALHSSLGTEPLAGGSATSIDALLYDQKDSWAGLGHRWLLLNLGWFGYGAVRNPMTPSSLTTQVYDGGGPMLIVDQADVRERRYVAYPPAGFVPDSIFVDDVAAPDPNPNTPQWSFMMIGADMSNAAVTMSDGVNTWQPTIGYRSSTTLGDGVFLANLVWTGAGITGARGYNQPILPLGYQNDKWWTVSITGIVHEGVTRSITYPVIAFNPRDTAANPVRGTDKTVVEYYEPDLDHYFITADPAEQAFVDGGGAGNWHRTNMSFKAGGTNPVCRFYGNQSQVHHGPNSHFYTASFDECARVKQDEGWWIESMNAFWINPALWDATQGKATCPAGQTPIYRAYNNGFSRGVDSNHRLTTDYAAYQATLASGVWKGEGVVMCAAP